VNSWKVILATVVIFGAGVFTGGLLVNYVNHSHRNNHRPQTNVEAHPPVEAHDPQSHTNNLASLPHPRPPEILGDKFIQQLDDALQLTPDEHASIQKIIADGQERNHAIWTNNSAQMREVIQDVRHRVREQLTSEQQKQFEDLMKRVPRRQNSTNAPVAEIDFQTRQLKIAESLLTNFPSAWSNTDLTPEQQIQKLKEMEQQNHDEIFRRLSEERIQELEAQRMTNTVLIAPTNAPAN
jgi:hypothetical protein